MIKNILLTLIGIFVLAVASWSQDVTGNLEGLVLDSEGAPIEAAKIAVSGPDLQGVREAITDERGHYFLFALPVGICTIKLQHPAFREASFQNVSVRLGRTTSLGEIRLKLKVLEEREITVIAERPPIDLTSTSGSSNLEAGIVETLPVARDYRSLTLLLPHAVESFAGEETNFSGATGLENRYFIDGIETTDPYRGKTGMRLPYNFIKEIEVKTGGYEAEFRSSLGAIVNVITSSGGNEFSGQAFGFFVNNRFSGESRTGAFEPRTGDFSQYDFGISLGGPIMHDRLWFFAAFNRAVEREEVDIPGQGFFLDRNTTNIFAGKLTWQLSRKTNIIFAALGDPSARNAVGETGGTWVFSKLLNPDPFLERIKRGGVNLSLKGTQILSDRFFVEASASWISQKDSNQPATERGRNDRAFIDWETHTLSGGSMGWWEDLSTEMTISLKGTWMFNRHTMKTGLEYRENRLDNCWAWSNIQRFNDNSFIDFCPNSEGILRTRIPSVFIQDSWEATRRLRLNFGLRWDGQYFLATNGKVNQKILDQYQPRIGILYQPGEIGTQKIYASFGRFYEDAMLYAMTFYGTDKGQYVIISYDHDPRIDPSGGDAFILQNNIQPEIEGLQGQYYDEFTLGYERLIGKDFKMGVRGIYRKLGQAIDDGVVDPATGEAWWGNPGSGPLSAFPKARREYTALELTVEKYGGRNLNFFASYVLSRNYGNYCGLGDYGMAFPNAGSQFDFLEQYEANALGLLPNDRTHVFKFSGSYRMAMGLTIGMSLLWESGTPLDEWGGATLSFFQRLMRPRGSAGRTPSIFDLNFRLMYDLSKIIKTRSTPKLFLDIFHVGSRRSPIEYDQIHYYNLDEYGNQIDPNPTYGLTTRYFPPMSARLGFEVGF